MIKESCLKHPFLMGLMIRLILALLLPILLDDGILLQGVKYTDIDYSVYTDAAILVQNGKSPYDRHTYRYTPFLAAILAWGSGCDGLICKHWWNIPLKWFGRILFCVADALCGMIILQMRQGCNSKKKTSMKDECNDKIELNIKSNHHDWTDALWWLYNPLPINICTRGSGESFIVLLPVLLTVMIATTDSKRMSYYFSFRRKSQGDIIIRAGICGIIHGIAIHAKLFPIIYTPSFMAYFSRELGGQYWKKVDTKGNESFFYRVTHFIKLWLRRILRPAPILFLFYSTIIFVVLTIAGVHLYGDKALEEGLLYHFSRLDHRHNYSIYWYGIYLARYQETKSILSSTFVSAASRILFVPQIVLLFQCSIQIAPYDLSFALFLQTFIFVVFNKVITGQYFTWYLCLLPLCANHIQWSSNKMRLAFVLLGVSICSWLGTAFLLEMKGYSVHLIVWLASSFVFGTSLNLLRVILLEYRKDAILNQEQKVIVKKIQ